MAQGKYPASGIGTHPASEIEELYADFYTHKSNRAGHERNDTVLRDDFIIPAEATEDEFELSEVPYGADFILVFLNGMLQKKDDSYTISGKVITFNSPRGENEYISIIYKPCFGIRGNSVTSEGQTNFSLLPDPNIINAVYVLTFRNGLLQMENVDYTISPTDVDFIDPIGISQYVSLLYRPTWETRDDFAVSGESEDTFSLSKQSASCAVMVYRNGIIQWPGDDYTYSEDLNEVVFTNELDDGEFVSVIYRISS